MLRSLIFPNSGASLFQPIVTALETLKPWARSVSSADSLFVSSFVVDDELKNTSFVPCAVDEFEYDFQDPNPFNWDLQDVLKQHHSGITSTKQKQQPAESYQFLADLDDESSDDEAYYGNEYTLDHEHFLHFQHSTLEPAASTKNPAQTDELVSSVPSLDHNNTTPSNSSGSASSPARSPPTSDSELESYTCEICHASLKLKSYLTRHMKKHRDMLPYKCPYHTGNRDTHNPAYWCEQYGTVCHPTGGFSRRDTLKMHLRARHFIYPMGTRLQSRGNTPGRCGGCFKEFATNTEWMDDHVCKNLCPAFVMKYT
ncbi:hypothetical protein OGAPHI_003001 [Ogataea philodendri]|uniref:C2H2-type domain-containing protein n=1 Tax=Ogataea philodendri TaxID=1378263 RepID=A0A9P8P8L0_9ASCO|nr:uncharacterized protein OGAPHI_003001 [Ogataea philodendri]KAH3667352.1 hypothetical protein OGAPHI_003001 [Ogataea philodendri]